jgi:pyruvate/2-oxoglutarate dehydrogenase complex dihydrolipoamide dehydrogenase (E3) component
LAVQLGSRVALLEKHRVGGDCTWTGCVPSKALLKVAKVAHEIRTADRYGLPAGNPQVDLGMVMAHVRSVVMDVYHEESPEALSADGIDVYLDAARFIDPHTLAVGDRVLKGRRFLLATGAYPEIPSIDGLGGVEYLTHVGVWDLDVLPRHLLAIGAGPSDSTAQIFAFTLTTDTGEVLGPFTLTDAEHAYRFDLVAVARTLRLDVVDSSGGSTGLIEFAIYGTPLAD